MTFAPQTLKDLAALWVSKGGVNLGIVGDAPHVLGGTSYHLGKRDLLPSAYSRVLPRDVAGLSEAASAIDLGRMHGTLEELQEFSVWFVAQVRANPTKYRDVREVIYSPNGIAVYRWDNNLRALRLGGDGTGQGDNSHRTHTHISFYRDSEFRDKRALFADYFTIPPAEEADMIPFSDARSRLIDLPAGTVLYDSAHKPVRTLTTAASVVSPFIVDNTYRAAFANVGTQPQLVLVKNSDARNVRLPDEVTTLIKQAKLDMIEKLRPAITEVLNKAEPV